MSEKGLEVEDKVSQPVITYEDGCAPPNTENNARNSEKSITADPNGELTLNEGDREVVYRLYKRRFAGLFALVILNIVAAMSWPWFGPISNAMAADFSITLDQVNWLGNSIGLVYLPLAFLIPQILAKYGLRRCYELGAVALILSAWIRYAGTARTLSGGRAYALLLIGQLFSAVSQTVYQIPGPKFSETWFNLQGRTTATMLIAISKPIGGAVGQLVSPLIGDSRRSILVLGILSTVVTPLVFLIGNAPPTPPTYAASRPPKSIFSLLRAMAGREVPQDAYMSGQERIDFTIMVIIFGALVAASNAFAILTAQIFLTGSFVLVVDHQQPVGYSDDVSGFLGACLLLTGIVAAIITAPLFDRVFTHNLALTTKFLVPCIAIAWLSLIWAVEPHNQAGLFVVMTIIGVCTVTMLPVGLELACEVTRNAEGSSAILLLTGNLCGVMFILVEGALRADENAKPPLNMRRALIFNGSFVMVASSLVFLFKGKQARKLSDEKKMKEALEVSNSVGMT